MLAVVHNGVDLERFHPAGNAARPTEPTVLFLGRVIPEKGPDILLRAARTLIGAKRRFRVRIVGSKGFSPNEPLSSYERRLRQIAEPIRDAVEFKPFVDRARIIDEYARASVFCVPSNWDDPCPLTLLEALACGLPTIASSRGGIPEIGGKALLYFQPPSVSEFADRLAYLIDDESARADWGRRARDRVLGLGWDEQYRKLRQVVEA